MVYRFIEFYALFSRLLLESRIRGTTGIPEFQVRIPTPLPTMIHIPEVQTTLL